MTCLFCLYRFTAMFGFSALSTPVPSLMLGFSIFGCKLGSSFAAKGHCFLLEREIATDRAGGKDREIQPRAMGTFFPLFYLKFLIKVISISQLYRVFVMKQSVRYDKKKSRSSL